MTRPLLLVDCETTGLDPARHVIWELAVIEYGSERSEHLWRIKPDLSTAEPAALQVGRYYERTERMCDHAASGVTDLTLCEPGDRCCWSHPAKLAVTVARMLSGATLLCANPAFDAGFLAALLRQHGQAVAWHYRLRDIGSMAWGYLSACLALGAEGRDAALGVPSIGASTDDFARALGVDRAGFERHTALGDCRLLEACLGVITGGTP